MKSMHAFNGLPMQCTYALLWSALPQSAVLLYCISGFLQFNPLKLIRSHPRLNSRLMPNPNLETWSVA